MLKKPRPPPHSHERRNSQSWGFLTFLKIWNKSFVIVEQFAGSLTHSTVRPQNLLVLFKVPFKVYGMTEGFPYAPRVVFSFTEAKRWHRTQDSMKRKSHVQDSGTDCSILWDFGSQSITAVFVQVLRTPSDYYRQPLTDTASEYFRMKSLYDIFTCL